MDPAENSDNPRLQELWQAYRAAPEAYETNRDLGLHLSGLKEFKLDAYPLLVKALSFERCDNASRHMIDRLGNICRLTGHFEGAVLLYRQGVRLFPETDDLALRLGDALSAAGEVDEAQIYYRSALDRFYRSAHEAAKPGSEPVHLLGPTSPICGFIGELAARPDLYLKSRELGLIDRARPILLAPDSIIANRALRDCWRDHIEIVTDPEAIETTRNRYARSWIYLDYQRIPDGRTLRRDLAHIAVQHQWEAEGRQPLLALDDNMRARGWEKLAALGVPEGAWFACLHVREGGYYAETEAWERGRLRNADITTYLPAIEAITGHGGWVVRIGDHTMTPLPDMPRVVDLTSTRPKDEALDIFCIAEARFMVATTSGPHNVADPFGTPVVATNWFCLGFWPLSSSDIIVHKFLRERASGCLLSLAEAMKPPLFGAWEPLLYDRMGLDIVDNTPEDIAAAVTEMLDRLDGVVAETEGDRRRQEAFRKLADPYRVGLLARAGRDFLRRHPELLDMPGEQEEYRHVAKPPLPRDEPALSSGPAE